jgi:hypothetical protein
MFKISNIIITFVASFFIMNAALADGHKGSFDFHTGWAAGPVTVIPVGEGHIMGTGVYKGATFNDSGSGYLHNGEAECFASFVVNNGVGENKGWCAWGDADGDRLYTSFSGDTQKGVNTIIGGTGKYVGWTGSGPWACYDIGSNGANRCNQSLNYTKP